jgi:hypothetical protein
MIARGFQPHAASYLFQSLWRPPPDPPIVLSTGDYDALFGRSRYQIAMQSRSRHRSQDMGNAEPIGPQTTALRVMAGDPPPAGSLFAALDTTLSQHARSVDAPADIIDRLSAYETAVVDIRASFNPLERAALASRLTDAVRLLDDVLARVGDQSLDGLRWRVAGERAQAADALLLDAGIVIDVTADTPSPVPGTAFDLRVTVWNGGPNVVTLSSIRPLTREGWRVAGAAGSPVELAPGAVVRRSYRVSVPADEQPTEPYFLRTVRTSAMYDWSGVADSVRTLPFEPFSIGADVELALGVDVRARREAEFAMVDKAYGEVRRPLLVLPAAAVDVTPRVAAIPARDSAARTVDVTVSAARDSMEGSLRLTAPAGWSVSPASVPVRLSAGESRTIPFTVRAPAGASGEHALRAVFDSGRRSYDEGYTLIDYPHIRPHALYHEAVVRAAVFPINIAQDLRIGYVEGAGDDGAAALRQLGAVVEPLDAAAIANGDLSVYDAIVAGIRAYEVRPDLLANNERLLDYVRGGGTFVVQYNKYELVDGGFMPYPATMSRPHGRVTDENAAVTLLRPEHRALSWPNRITTADFDGWLHERGLYFLDSFDSRYEPLLAMADPAEPPQQGSLVVARVGEGWYVYTGLALFRQLPEAVPGAYRLLANLVSLGRGTGTDR